MSKRRRGLGPIAVSLLAGVLALAGSAMAWDDTDVVEAAPSAAGALRRTAEQETGGGRAVSVWPADRVVTWDRELAEDEAVVLARLADPAIPHRPRIRDLMPSAVASNLRRAFAEAERRVVDVDTCAGLYSGLEADGLIKLRQTFYLPATDRQEDQVCASGALAFTQVGSPLTRLCRRFGHVDVDRATLALLHEALHFAGLGERPVTPGALSSAEINRAVRSACDKRGGGGVEVVGRWTVAGPLEGLPVPAVVAEPSPFSPSGVGGKGPVIQRAD